MAMCRSCNHAGCTVAAPTRIGILHGPVGKTSLHSHLPPIFHTSCSNWLFVFFMLAISVYLHAVHNCRASFLGGSLLEHLQRHASVSLSRRSEICDCICCCTLLLISTGAFKKKASNNMENNNTQSCTAEASCTNKACTVAVFLLNSVKSVLLEVIPLIHSIQRAKGKRTEVPQACTIADDAHLCEP